MAEKRTRKSSSRGDRTRDIRTANRFLEELSWLLESYSNLDFRVLAENIKTEKEQSKPLLDVRSDNGNIHFLVGTLPIIFNNVRFFPGNEDIVEFATIALGLKISRWEKRSRYEIIGLIVCETAKLDNERLNKLVAALARVTNADPNLEAIVADRKARSLNWNELIQLLTER